MIPAETIKNYNLKPYLKTNWHKGIVEVPVAKFIYFFKEDETNDVIFFLTIKNYEDDNVFDALLQQADKAIQKLKDFKKLQLAPLSKINKFDVLVFAPFNYTLLPRSDSSDFDKKIVQLFPAYCYEVAGDETPKDFNHMLRNILMQVDWNREPTPKIQYLFKNPKRKYGTTGKSFVIDKEANVYSALNNFESKDCFMNVKNLLNEEIAITWLSKGKFQVQSGNEKKEQDFDALKKKLTDFFRKCPR